ncbi:MAG TPA: hypothetical protein ENN31_02135 [Candidatus Vogelbacteria bacterium]|nr:hypothetical protein [Candidatus Vogelbacteria bacterium]
MDYIGGGVNLHNLFNLIVYLFHYFSQLTISPVVIFFAQVIYFSLAVLAFIGIVILFRRNMRLMTDLFGEKLSLVSSIASSQSAEGNARWQKIKNLANSESSADWKIAILEADKILDEMTKRMGYEGDSIGDRLKQIEPSDFLTLNDAWQAHKVRNDIVHSPNFELDSRQVKDTLKKYENVFKEFHFITPGEGLD